MGRKGFNPFIPFHRGFNPDNNMQCKGLQGWVERVESYSITLSKKRGDEKCI
jgi:hypothetical protein